MVSMINRADSDLQQVMLGMCQNMRAADVDGTVGLSKTELSSVESVSEGRAKGFLQSLSAQFDKLDMDSNAQLSVEEILSFKPQQQMGPPPGLELSSGESNGLGKALGNISNSFVQQLLNSYKSGDLAGDLSSLASSLTLAL